jgi:tetratricopeptide (TPR) repeat protein
MPSDVPAQNDDVDDLVSLAVLGAAAVGLYQLFGGGKAARDRGRAAQLLERTGALEQSDPQHAARLLHEACAADPTWAHPPNALAWMLAQHQVDLDDALVLAQQAIERAVDLDEQLMCIDTRAEVNARRGDYLEALADFRRCLRSIPPDSAALRATTLFRAALCHTAQEGPNSRDGRAALLEAVQLTPCWFDARLRLAMSQREMGLHDGAREQAQAAVDACIGGDAVVVGYGWALVHPSPEALARATALAWNELGCAHYRLGEFGQSELCHISAMEADPTLPYPWANLAILAARAGRPEARTHLERLIGTLGAEGPEVADSVIRETLHTDLGPFALDLFTTHGHLARTAADSWRKMREAHVPARIEPVVNNYYTQHSIEASGTVGALVVGDHGIVSGVSVEAG